MTLKFPPPLHPRQPQHTLTSKFSYFCVQHRVRYHVSDLHTLFLSTRKRVSSISSTSNKFDSLQIKILHFQTRAASAHRQIEERPKAQGRQSLLTTNRKRTSNAVSHHRVRAKLVCRISTTAKTMCLCGMERCELIELLRPWHVETSHRLSCK